MANDELEENGISENIKILATDDEKIKSYGEILSNDSSREILQLLFNQELSANQIAQKSDISLQLVKYHLMKLQDLGVVKISKIEKNSKSQDMKIYTASKFSIVIVPPKLSDKTKESKLLVRSFRHIYKVVGLGIATGLSGLFSSTQIQQDRIVSVPDSVSSRTISSIEESAKSIESSEFLASDESISASAPISAESQMELESVESESLTESIEVTDLAISSSELIATELFIPLVVITLVLGGLTVYYMYKFFKKSK
ncbi:MAG: winged helix-turn-helix transcriptional regulator [Nitrosopumilus sp.]|nr:winged helix-turn-helix domain-containing protein [Nitrosopumilus sp.]NNL37185.1 winged helix-turn-helix transcriptional regulator [Nitrosopumilus sp.]